LHGARVRVTGSPLRARHSAGERSCVGGATVCLRVAEEVLEMEFRVLRSGPRDGWWVLRGGCGETAFVEEEEIR
jgi:hypothetical protein